MSAQQTWLGRVIGKSFKRYGYILYSGCFLPPLTHAAHVLPGPLPRRLKELPVDDFHEFHVLGAFSPQLIGEKRVR